jgi:hypothetical protein
MKNNQKIFDTVVKVCSIVVLLIGFILLLYIYFGPSLGLIDAESASWGIVIVLPIIVVGIISTILSFMKYTKTATAIIVLYVLIFVLNIWNQHRIDTVAQQHMIDMQSQQNSQHPPLSIPLTK